MKVSLSRAAIFPTWRPGEIVLAVYVFKGLMCSTLAQFPLCTLMSFHKSSFSSLKWHKKDLYSAKTHNVVAKVGSRMTSTAKLHFSLKMELSYPGVDKLGLKARDLFRATLSLLCSSPT